MIGIDRKTGRRLDGFDQFVSRVAQVMTTPIGARVKRPKFGSNVRRYLSENMSDNVRIKVQSASIEAFYVAENGLTDFVPSRCVCRRGESGFSLYIEGVWNGRTQSFEVLLNAISPSESVA